MTIHGTYPNSVVKMLGWNRNSLDDIVNGDADLGVCVRESYSRSQLKLRNLPYYIDHEVLFCDRPVVFLRKDHPLLQQGGHWNTFWIALTAAWCWKYWRPGDWICCWKTRGWHAECR